jgi:3-oxoacyl-(acyl-carrier-protein) synthase
VTDLLVSDPRKTIVVTGIGVVSPYGIGLDCLQAGMLSGKCCLKPAKDLYPGFEGTTAQVCDLPLPANGANRRYSRSDRLAMVAARDAVANLSCESVAFRKSGVFMASTVAGLSEIDPAIAADPGAWYRRGDGLARAASYPPAHVADSVAQHLGIHGPRCAVSAACASSAMAIALAANLLLDGVAPMMLAGGSDALCPFTLSGFSSLQALDPEPCRPFDQNRKGLNLGEGAAVLVLETLAAASARKAKVLAVLRGWAMTNDAFHSTAPHTRGNGLADCMRVCMEMAKVSGDEIGYVNAHGTGTPLNDVAESNAYEAAFRGRSRPIPVSSTKSYFGHCLGASGALEAAITITAVRCGALLPTLRLTDPIESPGVNWLRGEVVRQPLPLAMSVSAGFGGNNTALIFGNGTS